MNSPDCPVCGSATTFAGAIQSSFSGRSFELASCPTCHYSFVVDPRTDFAALYDQQYYRGRGADHTVDYERELADSRTVRVYEWRAMLEIIEHLRGPLFGVRWLDYGCGLGGFVRYARNLGIEAYGFEEGYAAERIRQADLPRIEVSDLGSAPESFDVVSAIEVVEHLPQPIPVLQRIAGLLRSGGLFFLTTGNAEPFRGRLERWSYVQPDIHVGYFEPGTLDVAFRRVGLEPSFPGFVPGFTDLIRYKVLKNLGFKRQRWVERCIPWPLVARAIDRRYRTSAMPIGWRQ